MSSQEPYGIEWARRPSADEMVNQWRITRPPQKSPMTLLILSHDITGCYTHFWHGRTTPHKRTGCEPCDQGKQPEWHGYLACVQPNTRIRWILEITKGCAKVLDEHFRAHRSLKGTIIQAGRTSNKPNGRQFVKILSTLPAETEMQKAPDLQPILARMWQLREQPLFAHDEISDPLKIASIEPESSAGDDRKTG